MERRPLAEHGDERLAALLGGDAQLGRLARLVAGLVERDVEDLRAVGRSLAAYQPALKATLEAGPLGFGDRDLEPVAAVVDVGRDLGRAPSAVASSVPSATLRVRVRAS